MSVTIYSADGKEKEHFRGAVEIRIKGFVFCGSQKLAHLKKLLHLPERPDANTVRLIFQDGERYDVKFGNDTKAAAFEVDCAKFVAKHAEQQLKGALEPVANIVKVEKSGGFGKSSSPQKRVVRPSHEDDFCFTSQDNISGDS